MLKSSNEMKTSSTKSLADRSIYRTWSRRTSHPQANGLFLQNATTRCKTTQQAQKDYWFESGTLTDISSRLERVEQRKDQEIGLSAPMQLSDRMRLALLVTAT